MEEDGQAMSSNPGVPLGQDKKTLKKDKNQDKQDKKPILMINKTVIIYQA